MSDQDDYDYKAEQAKAEYADECETNRTQITRSVDGSLRDRITAAIRGVLLDTDWSGEIGAASGEVWVQVDGVVDPAEVADAVIAELERDGVPPATSASRLQARLDNIGRWLHPGLWSAWDGRRGIFLRIIAGERIEPPPSARSTDWKADDE